MLGLAYMMDIQVELSVVGENGSIGKIKVNLIPTDRVYNYIKTGQENLGELYEKQG